MTKRQQQAEQLRRQQLRAEAQKKLRAQVMQELVEKFKASGDADIAAQKLSMAYLLVTIGNAYAEDCVELMEKHHIVRKKLKTTSNNLRQSFDCWDKEMRSMVPSEEYRRAFCNDTLLLSEILEVYLTSHIDVERGPYYAPKLFLPEKKQ